MLLYLIHLPILLSTTYCLAAGIAGGWHLLTERGCCRRDLWAKKRPVGVRDRCLGLQCWAPSQTLYAILHVCTNFSNRQSYVGSSTFPWRLACVRFSTLCYRERPVGMNDESFLYMMWGADISPVSPELSTMMHDTRRCHDYFQQPCWKVTVRYVRMWFKQNTAEYHLSLGHWHVKTVQIIVSWRLIYICIKMKGMWCWEIKVPHNLISNNNKWKKKACKSKGEVKCQNLHCYH